MPVNRPLNKVSFSGSGGDQLAGRLDLPDRRPRAFPVFAHCRDFLQDISAQRLDTAVRRLGAALLVLHSPVDDLVHSSGTG